MPTREQMHALVQEISGAHEARAAGIASLRQTTTAWLGEAAHRRQTQAQQLRAELAQTAARRRAGVAAWLRAAARGRVAQTKQLHADLAQTAARRRAGVAAWLGEVTRGRNTEAHQLRANLAQTDAQRRAGITAWLREVAQTSAQHRDGITAWLHGVTRGRQTQTQHLRADLAQTDARRRAAVAAWLRGVARGHAAVQAEWQTLAEAIRQRRNGSGAPAEETPGVVFQFLADRPDGAPLIEIEKELRLDRFGAARVVKRLMEDGKAEKRGRLYFAA